MRKKRPQVASLDQIKITRKDTEAIIEYADEQIWTTHLQIGPEVQWMTDQEILDRWNDGIRATERLAASYEHIAVEIPIGKPQIEYYAKGYQWTPRGDVLRCVIDGGGPDGEPTIYIDDHELSWQEFGRLLSVYAGWGMRVVFVPDDSLHETPRIDVCEPKKSR